MNKITVIIPCHNTALFIDRCMTSVTTQTIGIENLEIICIDDASTDDTLHRLQTWEQRFPDNIILIPLDSNRKPGAARNIGLSYASTDLVSFVDSDDWLEPDCFEQLYSPMQQYDCDVVFCGFKRDPSGALTYFDRDSRSYIEENHLIIADTEELTKHLMKDKIMGRTPCGKLIRKTLLTDHAIFFPEDLVYEDNFWIPLLHIYTKKLYVIESPLYHWFVNLDSITLSKNVDFHTDWITIQMIKLHEYERRGLFQKYREELEFDLLTDAAGFMSLLISQYDNPCYSLYQLEKELVTSRIPDYKHSKYAADVLSYSGSLLEALYAPLDRKQFQEFAKTIKQVWKDLGQAL